MTRLSRSAKVQAQHLRRLAIVYVRQSSPQQVLHHRESTALQYEKRRRWEHVSADRREHVGINPREFFKARVDVVA